MGYCSATGPHDEALHLFLKYVPQREKPVVMRQWFEYWKDQDWDCESDSDFADQLIEYGIMEDPYDLD